MAKKDKRDARATSKSDKRGSGPFTVLEADDLAQYKTLSEKINAMLENRCEIFIRNVAFLCDEYGLSQAKLCSEKLEGRLNPPQLTNYKKRGRDIPLSVMVLVASAFGMTVEEISGQLLSDRAQRLEQPNSERSRPLTEYEKYTGVYDLTYFDTSKPLAENNTPAGESLDNAVLAIYVLRNPIGTASFHVTAILNCTATERQQVAGLLSGIDMTGDGEAVYRHFESVLGSPGLLSSDNTRLKYLYDGELRLTEQMTEITLRQVRGNKSVYLLAHNRAADSSEGKKYKGGLATMMSVSRGEEHMPCIQAAIMVSAAAKGDRSQTRLEPKSRFDFLTKEQIAQKLYLTPPKVELGSEVSAIIAYMKFLFSQANESAITGLSDDDKGFCLQSFAEKKLADSLKRNMLEYYKISVQMDSDIYKIIRQD